MIGMCVNKAPLLEKKHDGKFVELFYVDIRGDEEKVRRQASKISGYRSMEFAFGGGITPDGYVVMYDVKDVLGAQKILSELKKIDGVREARVLQYRSNIRAL